MLAELTHLFERDLAQLVGELEQYPDEASLWRVAPGIVNPAGNLALHVAGNLRAMVGERVGGVPYARDRDAEFSRRDVPRTELLGEVRAAAATVETVLSGLDEAALRQPSPVTLPHFPPGATTGYLLTSLYGHLNWHLGQVNYHRRLLSLHGEERDRPI